MAPAAATTGSASSQRAGARHRSTQIVRKTKTQMTSTRCQNSDTPWVHDEIAAQRAAAHGAHEQQAHRREAGGDVGAVEAGQQPVDGAVRVVRGAEVERRVLGDLVGQEGGAEGDRHEQPAALAGAVLAARRRGRNARA